MVSNTDFCKMLGESATEKVIKYSDLEKLYRNQKNIELFS